jgi:HEAT repeat protein
MEHMIIESLLAISILCARHRSSQHAAGRLESVDQLLQERKVSLTKPALVEALGNSDPEVRWLAALKLAEMKEVSAIPDISAALRNTGIASSQGLKIASALVSLGSREGRQAMSNFCHDPRGALQLRVTAATYLLQIGDEVCFQVVVEALQKPADDDVRMMALSLVPQFKNISENERETIGRLVTRLLSDKSPSVRLSASIAVVNLGLTAALPVLKAASVREKEEPVRSQMLELLKVLERRREHQ